MSRGVTLSAAESLGFSVTFHPWKVKDSDSEDESDGENEAIGVVTSSSSDTFGKSSTSPALEPAKVKGSPKASQSSMRDTSVFISRTVACFHTHQWCCLRKYDQRPHLKYVACSNCWGSG